MPNPDRDTASRILPIADLEAALTAGGLGSAIAYYDQWDANVDTRPGVTVVVPTGSDVARLFVGLHALFGNDAFALARVAVIVPVPAVTFGRAAFAVIFPGYHPTIPDF